MLAEGRRRHAHLLHCVASCHRTFTEALSTDTLISVGGIACAGALVYFRDRGPLFTGAATLFILFILTCDGDGPAVPIDAVPTGDPMFNINGLPIHGATDVYGNLHGTTYNDHSSH